MNGDPGGNPGGNPSGNPSGEWSTLLSVQNTARRTAALINALSVDDAGSDSPDSSSVDSSSTDSEAADSEAADAAVADAVVEVLRAYGEPGPFSLSARDIAEMRAAAESLREVFAVEDDRDAAGAVAVLNPLLERTTGTFRLTSHSTGSPWHPHLDSHDDAPWGEWFLASSCLALTVLVWDRQRPPGGLCASPRCRNVFVTLNSGPARRYCSVRCATRERVAAHRRARAE
ncbi:CGNR zinc finger domain-containing protein [Streptomyces sp. NPDC057654]|uniref:CGNR zinc finger domain-containing protein n=1 Tax=Streptomyces sp. NPDC057654 TaxID=3346196 RepID=UPI0036C98432